MRVAATPAPTLGQQHPPPAPQHLVPACPARDKPHPRDSPLPRPALESARAALVTSELGGIRLPSVRPVTSVPAADRPELTLRQIRRRLFALGWPAMLENLMQSALFMINTALAGRLGAEALAAAGISNFLMFFTFSLFFGMSIGTLALVARSYGARDLPTAYAASRQGMVTAIAASFVSVLVLALFAAPILRLVGGSEAIVALAAPYLALSALTAPFQTVVVMVGAVQRGTGDTRTPMLGSVLMAASDLVIGVLLVSDMIQPGGFGLQGIAVAMGLARVATAGFMLAAIYRSPHRAGVFGSYRPDWAMQRRLLRVAGPAVSEMFITIGGIMAFSIIGLQLGTVSFAAQNVVGPIMSLAYMPSLGLGIAASTAVGQSLGARDPQLAHRYGREAAIAGTLVSTLVGVVVFLLPRELMSVFTTDPAVLDAGELPVRTIALFMPVVGLATTMPGALRGAGDTRAMLLISLLALWIIRVPLALGLGLFGGFGLTGLWIGAGVNYLTIAAASLARFASGRWQTIRL